MVTTAARICFIRHSLLADLALREPRDSGTTSRDHAPAHVTPIALSLYSSPFKELSYSR